MTAQTLTRAERLRSLKVIRRLFEEGRSGFVYPFRYIWLKEESAENVGVAAGEGASMVVAEGSAGTVLAGTVSASSVLASSTSGEGASVGSNGVAGGVEVMFSVPKRFLKRANKRNLVRRRAKESYRLNKTILTEVMGDRRVRIALVYSTKKIHEYKTINNAVERILGEIGRNL
ncbi:MAG: ribonuclease P protein component [Rikenellaceae bacterium]|nr:ribonuclease P protein component [Rikenellaceae bacterium]